MENKDRRYDDMIGLPHHVSRKHPQMSRETRAAQFASFKALTGYEDCIAEAARQTKPRIEPDDAALQLLNAKMQLLGEALQSHPEIFVTYFVPDQRKSGGEYVTVSGHVKRIDEITRTMVFTDNREIPIDDISDMAGDIFTMPLI